MATNLMPVLLLGLISSLGPSVNLFVYVAERFPDSEACDAYCTQTQRPLMLILIHRGLLCLLLYTEASYAYTYTQGPLMPTLILLYFTLVVCSLHTTSVT